MKEPEVISAEKLLDEIKKHRSFNSLHHISKQRLESPAIIWWYKQIIKCYYMDALKTLEILKLKCEGNFYKFIIYDAMMDLHNISNRLDQLCLFPETLFTNINTLSK